MKKNITINLFGSLYAIDEDAYDLLKVYQENMRSYFSRQEGGNEIVEDIEHRIAELMEELKSTGVEAISIEHVQEIINRIGKPEEMDGVEEDETREQTKESDDTPKGSERGNKKLFRNPDDKLLGGVASGLACFLGTDVVPVRLLWVILACCSFGIVLGLYMLFWLVVPEAASLEDKLRMQGKSVNMENLRDEIISGVHKAGDMVRKPGIISGVKSFCDAVFRVLVTLIKVFFILILGMLIIFFTPLLIALVPVIMALLFGGVSVVANSNLLESEFVSWLQGMMSGSVVSSFLLIVTTLFILAFVVFSLYFAVRGLFVLVGTAKPVSRKKLIVLLLSWAVLFVLAVTCFSRSAYLYHKHSDEIWKEQREKENQLHVEKQLEYLNEEGWQVVTSENMEPHYINSGQYYTGNRSKKYIDTWSNDPNMRYEVQKRITLAPGVYNLKVAVRANGEGGEVFAKTAQHEYWKEIPAYGNEGGELWNEIAKEFKDGVSLKGQKELIYQTNNSRGRGWSVITVNRIVVDKDSTLYYGVSNAHSGNWNGTWFSATDFKVEREERSN